MTHAAPLESTHSSQQLVKWFDPKASYVVAFSGGVDSSVVACAAGQSQSKTVLATARGPSVSRRDLEDAASVAKKLSLQHEWIDTREIADPNYRANGPRRCYFCKSHLFAALIEQFPNSTIVTGTNLDDLADYRPGLDAAKQSKVRSPLAELGIDKQGVRQLARYWNLPVTEKPASPCLASRIAYGVEVTPERLAMVEQAETLIRQLLSVDDCRVRLHESAMARIELPLEALPTAMEPALKETLLSGLKELGFHFVTIDLEGLRSGSLNRLIQISGTR